MVEPPVFLLAFRTALIKELVTVSRLFLLKISDIFSATTNCWSYKGWLLTLEQVVAGR